MDAIKKKMINLAMSTEEAKAKTLFYEQETKRINENADKFEEQLRVLHKKTQFCESQYDTCCEQIFETTMKLEEKEKLFGNAEAEIGGLGRRIVLLEEEVERSEERLAKAVTELAHMSHRADSTIKKRQLLENSNSISEEQVFESEHQLKEEKFMLGESELKNDDIARKLATMEAELERSNERGTLGEKKIVDLEEELRVIGQNLQQLEVSEEKALQREESLQTKIKNLTASLKTAETREENAIMNIQRLNIRIDQLEEDLLNEKLKIKKTSDDLDSTFTELFS